MRTNRRQYTALATACLCVISAAAAATSCAVVNPDAAPRGWDSYDGFPIWRGLYATEAVILQQARALLAASSMGNHEKNSTHKNVGRWQHIIIDEGWADISLSSSDETVRTRAITRRAASRKRRQAIVASRTRSGESPVSSLSTDTSSSSFRWFLDPYGRPIPNPAMFPSAVNATVGFTPLISKLKAIDPLFELGLWMIKGITQQAVEDNLPILGTNYTARDVALVNQPCDWHQDVFAVNMSHPAGQVFYDSVMSLYASWGISYVKVDCIFGVGNYVMDNIQGVSNAVGQAVRRNVAPDAPGRMVLSISPGVDTSNAMADTLRSTGVDAYRITGDLWDCWNGDMSNCFGHVTVWWSTLQLAHLWSQSNQEGIYGKAQHPDPDMIALGTIRLGFNHTTNFTTGMLRYVFGLWTVTKSPIILGGDLTTIDNNPDSLRDMAMFLANRDLAEAHADAVNSRLIQLELLSNHTLSIGTAWTAFSYGEPGAVYVFLGNHGGMLHDAVPPVWSVSVPWSTIFGSAGAVPPGGVVATDLWTGRPFATDASALTATVAPNDAIALLIRGPW